MVFANQGRGADIPANLAVVNPYPPYNSTIILNNFFGRQVSPLLLSKVLRLLIVSPSFCSSTPSTTSRFTLETPTSTSRTRPTATFRTSSRFLGCQSTSTAST